MNIQKYTKEACGHLFKHFERAKDKYGNYVKFGNRDIDLSLSCLNYNLAPNRGMTQSEYLDKRLSEVYHIKKKDLNVMCSWVITVPDDLQPEKLHQFFYAAYHFMAHRYGEENVISAYVHLDENREKGHAHMHFAFIPVIYDRKKERFKVSAKDVINKKELQVIHKEAEDYISKSLKCPVHLLNGNTKQGNKTIEELKMFNDRIEKERSEFKELSRINQEISNEIFKKEEKIMELQKEQKRLKEICRKIREIIKSLLPDLLRLIDKERQKQRERQQEKNLSISR